MSQLRFRLNGRTHLISSLFCLAIVNGFTTVLAQDNNSTTNSSTTSAKCSLIPVDGTIQKKAQKMLKDEETYLVNYKLKFPANRSNPLVDNFRHIYSTDTFSRIRRKHGQTLLSLAFNYGVISLMTLTFGTDELEVNVYESPTNCLTGMSENESLNVVLYLLARDFDYTNRSIHLIDEERVCLQYIEPEDGLAHFKPRCYNGDKASNMTDPEEIGNKWINGLYVLMAIVKVLLFCFGPLFFVEYASTLSQEAVPYVIKLGEPLLRTLFISKNISDFVNIRGDRILNLSNCRGYPKLRQALENAPFGRPFVAEIDEYDILAASNRLIMENEVPVTFWGALAESIFRCKVKNVGPMQSCCYVDMFRDFSCVKKRIPWINFWTKVGSLLLIIFIPFLYYLRVILFYAFEVDELAARRSSAAKLGLTDSFDNSLVHYFSPTHWAFIFIYCIYFVSAFTLAYLTRTDDEGRFRSIVVGSFADLRRLSYLRVFQLMVENFLWPFKRYGLIGCLVIIVYWPIVLPLTLIVYLFYSIPTIYLTIRMIFYSRRNFLEQIRTRSGVRKYQMTEKEDNNLDLFQMDHIVGVKDGQYQPAKLSEIQEEVDELDKFRAEKKKARESGGEPASIIPTIVRSMRIRPTRFFQHMFASVMCIISLYSLLIIVAECFGSLVEIAVFTMMGIVVNAGMTAKYAGLVLMVIVYTYDCFNNIQVRYFKLNGALFAEIRRRVKGLDTVTSLPSYLQENQAFKSQEQSEQAAYENPDDIAQQPPRHWLINDLVLFVDNEDAFRIPRRLFKQVCEIRVSGVPGPVYEGVLEACFDFLKMVIFVVFVFVIVMSFGDIYELSSSTQMMAVLATGFLPMILKQFMEPKKPDIEVYSVSFKSKLDEVIKNFWQLWPIHDFTFKALPDSDPAATNTNDPWTWKEIDNTKKKLSEKRVTAAKQSTANQVTENKAAENKVPENAATENKVSENKVTGNKVFENKVSGNKVHENKADVKTKAGAANPSSDADAHQSVSPWVNNLVHHSLGRFVNMGGNQQQTPPTPPTPLPPPLPPSSVPLDRSQNNSSVGIVYQVDLLVRLPAKYEDEWVDGWSNIIQVKEVKQKQGSDVAESMIEAAAAKAGNNA